MKLDTAVLEATIRRVLAQLPESGTVTGDGVFPDMDSAIAAADKAAREYRTASMAERRRYVAALREVMLRPENLDHMAG